MCVGAALALHRQGKAKFSTEKVDKAPTFFILFYFFFFLANLLFSLRQMSEEKTFW